MILPPAPRESYLEGLEPHPADPPRAVVTTHPAHGLDWLLDLWSGHIRPQAPTAELWIYSAILDRGMQGGEVPEEMRSLLAKVKEAGTHGVRVAPPMGDSDMAEVYRSARVHLYPGHAEDMGCFTLVESQACGLPAVARPLGAAGERIRDGQTGCLAPDDAAFANVAARLLSDEATYGTLSRDAQLLARTRTYELMAAEFEAGLG
jgi:glycosyltransferase involved in cell wall biosynthesis